MFDCCVGTSAALKRAGGDVEIKVCGFVLYSRRWIDGFLQDILEGISISGQKH